MLMEALIGLVVAIALLSPSARAETVDSAIAFHTDTGSEVVSLTGYWVSSYGDFQFISLDGNIFAGSRHSKGGKSEHITAYNASTGEQTYRIDDAFAPVVVADGNKIASFPDRWANRDPYATSVWVRNRRGKERRIVPLTGLVQMFGGSVRGRRGSLGFRLRRTRPHNGRRFR
jgi:hypothetical protein